MSLHIEKSTVVEENTKNGPPHNQLYGHWDPNETVVISGMSGKFPECDNIQELMDNLFAGVDLITNNDRRWPNGYCNLPGIGTLKDIMRFDAAYFGVPPKHVHMMDPQLRIILELTYEALLDAGVNPVEVRGSRTGVYYALSTSDADTYWSATEDRANGISMLGSCRSIFANQVSFHFDFSGPSFTVDSACSTSLVALNQAVTDMRIGLTDAAIVCGSNIMLNPFYSQHLLKLGVLSPETLSQVFDAKATGYVRSEAAVVLYLQKKSDAKRVYADVVHVRNNTDGFKSVGMVCPSGKMQSLNSTALYRDLGLDPSTVGYVEAHGTGTKVGDREELNGLADVFCKKRSTALLVGSLKSNMGHSEPAAGLCSIVKVLIAMHTGYIPANLHYDVPNLGMPALLDGRIKVVDTVQKLPNDLVGINTFGFGGTNSHVLLRRGNEVKGLVATDQLPRLVAISGRTETALNYQLDKIESLPRDDDFVGLLHDIHRRNIHKHGYRGYTILNTNSPNREVSHIGEENRPVWFICTGWGGQWMGRTKELMKFVVFERRIQMCSRVLENEGINLYDIISSESDKVPDDLITVFVTIGATQLALIDLVRSTGIEPDALIGISMGELTCAYIDGTVTAEQVMQVAYHTARWAQEASLPSASMAVVCGLSYEQVKALCPPEIVVAVHNDAKTCTVVGPEKQVPQFVKSLLSKGIVAKMIKDSAGVAFHSRHITKEAQVLADKIKDLIPDSKQAHMLWISSSVPTQNGTVSQVQNFTVDYFMNIVTSTVLVQEALQHIPDNAIVMEISPHCALQPTLLKVLPASALSIGLMSRDEPKQAEFMLTGLGKMYNAGVQMNLASLYPRVVFPVPRGTHMISPLIQWDHSAEWTVPKLGFKTRKDGSRANKFSLVIDLTTEKDRYLRGHVINWQQTFPAAGYLTLAWKAFAQVNENWFENLPVKLENVEFHEHTLLPDSGVLTFLVKFPKHFDHSSEFEIFESNRLVASGFISMLEEECNEPLDNSEAVSESELLPLTAEDIYRDFRLRGFQYAGQFSSMLESDNRCTSGKVEWRDNWVTFLDSIFQFAQLGTGSQELCLPKKLKKLCINPQAHKQIVAALSDGAAVPVKMDRDINLVKSSGIKLQGLQLYMEHKVQDVQKDPELEKYIFIPYLNLGKTPLGDTTEVAHHNALTVIMQMVYENLYSVSIKEAVELAGSQKEVPLLAPVLVPLINRQLMMNVNITVITEAPGVLQQSSLLDSMSIKVEVATSDALQDRDCHLLFGSSQHLFEAANLLKAGSFLLLERIVNEDEVELPGFSLVAKQCAGNITYLLLRKDSDSEQTTPIVVQVTGQKFSWLGELQASLKNNKFSGRKVILVNEDDPNCGLLGLVTCLMHEPGCDNVSCVFIKDPRAPAFSLTEPLYASQLQKQLCMNVYKKGAWGSMRHIPIGLPQNTKYPTEFAQMEVLKRGDLSTLSWVEGPLKFYKPQENKELCQVYYASVDHAEALRVSEAAQSLQLGQEFSGYSSSGQCVMGFVSSGALATQVVATSSLLWHVPDCWSLVQAATVPTAYITSFYALLMRGCVRASEWVLIHAGGSAVGQAAIAICLHTGCNVITTVPNEEEYKRVKSLFQHLSGSHIMDYSGMEDQVLAITGGHGVDVIFNTLQSSKWYQALINCLARDGRFLDLALPSLSKNKALGTSLMSKTYHNIQLDLLFEAQNKDMQKVAQLMKAGLESGIVTPLPAKVYPESEVEQAFRFVSNNKFTGKVLIEVCAERSNKLGNPERRLVAAIPKLFFNPERVYVLAGGLGGVGMEVSEWLVQRGARKLVLICRRGVTSGYKSMQIRRWRDAGVTVMTTTQGITNEEGAVTLLQKATRLGPVGGIFVLTMVLRDALLEKQTKDNFQEVCKAKIDVTRSLDTVSQRLCPELEYFVVFSSVASGRGLAPGISPYGMANSGMERICEARHAMGLPALAIQFGPIGDVGYMFDTFGSEAVIYKRTVQCISSCLTALEKFMTQSYTVVASHVIPDKQHQNNSTSATEKEILNVIANVLGVNDITAVNLNMETDDFGIDSIMSTEIKNTLEDQFSVTLTSRQIYSIMASTLSEQSA